MTTPLSADEKNLLVEIAREAIITYVKESQIPDRKTDSDLLQLKRGCFVTIKTEGRLRGCIGNFLSEQPLYKLVQEMAVSAATRDPRFYPMKTDDVENFNLEISVLSPLKKIESVEEIEVGAHGLYIEKNSYRGVLLPQVAVEHGWSRETFLDQTCAKAGLAKGGWKDGAEIYIFSAQVFGE